MAKRKKKLSLDNLKAKGFFRLQINEDGKIKGDTGWEQNQITNDGFEQYLCMSLAGMAGSKNVAFAMLGTGDAPLATATSLDGEITDVEGTRCAVTPTVIASKTVQFAFTLASNIYTEPKAISNVGLINHSSTSQAGTIFAGNTFASSTLNTNQAVYGSYQIRFQ